MGAMKATAEKSSPASTSHASASRQPFLKPVGGGDFFPPVQTKLTVNKPGDKFEQEADKTADKVMRMAAPGAGAEKLQRQPDEKIQKREEEKILRAAAPPTDEPKIQRREEERILRAAAPPETLQKAEEPKLQKAEDRNIQKAEAEHPHRAEEKIFRAADDKLQKAEEPKIQKAPAGEEKLQREAAAGGATAGGAAGGAAGGDAGTGGGGAVSASVQSTLHGKTTGGEPLASNVRGFMEPRFNADFTGVRVHHDSESASLSNQLGARAFTYQNHIFFARGQYQPGASEGQHLLAHELTHTIQQGHAVQLSPQVSTTTTPPPIQRLGVQDALDYFADKALNIPGFRMLTVLLGFNPINMQSVDRNAANLLRALIELIPGGHLITQALDNHGIINKAAAWLEQKISALGDIGGAIVAALKQFIDSLSWTDIFDLGGVWDRAKRIFTDPISRLIDFGVSVAVEILKMVKDAILKPLAALAQGTRGYDLLCAILGQDPVSGEPVPRTAETLLGGFMKLIGQEEIWENIKKGNAIARAYAWFQNALSGLMGMVRAIPQKIVQTLTSLTFRDVITVAGAFTKILGAFVNIAGDFISWGLSTIWDLLKIVFDVVKPGLLGYIMKTGAALKSILKNPIPFLRNLVNAAKLGFANFADNVGDHLKAGLIDWLTGSLEGVYIPKALSLIELGKFAMSVLGVTWAQIRGKIVAAIGPSGERVMQGLELAFDVVKKLVTGGIAAVWEMIKEKLSDLKDQVVSGIISFVVDTIVKKAIPKLIGMFIPGAGFIPAIMSIYDTIMVFVQKISKIIQVVTAFIDSIVTIAAGNITAAANRVEKILAGLLSLAISFLAGFLGLGKVTDKIMGVVQKVRAKVDAAIGAAVNWVVGKAKAMFASLFGGKDGEKFPEEMKKKLGAGLAAGKAAVARFAGKRVGGALLKPLLAGIRVTHGLSSLEPVVKGGVWYVQGKINPEGEEATEAKADSPEAIAAVAAAADAAAAAALASAENGKKAKLSGDARETKRRAEEAARTDVVAVPTKRVGEESGPGLDVATIGVDPEGDVLELMEVKAGRSPRAVKSRASSRPIPTGVEQIAAPAGKGSAAKAAADPAAAAKIVTGQAVLVKDGKLVQNQLSAITENLKANVLKMYQVMDEGIAAGTFDEATANRVKNILSGKGGTLKFVIDIEAKAKMSPEQFAAAQALIQAAFNDLMKDVADKKTKIKTELRSSK